jgi:hypothetical protein
LADHNLTSVSGHCLLAASLHFDVPFCFSGVHPKISLSLIQALLNWLRLRRARSAGGSGPRDTRANNSPSEQSCTNTHEDVHGNGRKSHFSMTLAWLAFIAANPTYRVPQDRACPCQLPYLLGSVPLYPPAPRRWIHIHLVGRVGSCLWVALELWRVAG